MSHEKNRREFLKITLATSLSILLFGCSAFTRRENPIEDTSEKKKVDADIIIIGSGIAGLAAANTLRAKGYSTLILEARDRIGGRVWTDRSLDHTALDLGASWIHGIKDNPLTKLTQKYSISTVPFDYDALQIYDATGKPLTEKEQSKISALLEKIINKVKEKREQVDADFSLQKAINQVITKMALTEQDMIQLNYAINTEIEHEYSEDASRLSFLHWDDGGGFGGGDVLIPDGYDQIIKNISQKLIIKTKQIVQKVGYNKHQVTIKTNQGVFYANRALITLPLGVLKKGTVSFSPALPKSKQDAIKRLGMGVLNKVYLRFPSMFWDEEDDLLGYISKKKGEWAEFLNMAKFLKKPVLLGFNAGENGRAIERLTDRQIIESAMQVLRRMYGQDIPEPVGWLITRWNSDPFTFGSYSYIAVNSSLKDREVLAKPVGSRLFFAGEATSSEHAATVHGAYLSGVKAAEQMMSKK
ncbi:flavin monoamine oxidase family protein [Bacillus thuringiensis]|uniref:flavin monoamine oxidase family protein n=1 Tax=Bacillus thuringiensis TaxID=1428 RepID=UPI001642F0EC|nr:FAD-dependent oxidoreductase [Bacillus thuringiensis]